MWTNLEKNVQYLRSIFLRERTLSVISIPLQRGSEIDLGSKIFGPVGGTKIVLFDLCCNARNKLN